MLLSTHSFNAVIGLIRVARKADADFPSAFLGSSQEQIRNVRASNQEQTRDGGFQEPNRGGVIMNHAIEIGHDSDTESGICRRIRGNQVPMDDFQIGLRLLQSDPVFEPADTPKKMSAPPDFLGRAETRILAYGNIEVDLR
jgi:hypothetical protein